MGVKFKPLACGFHEHTDNSLDGAATCATKIMYADKLGRIASCITDHGVMSGLAEHWIAAKKAKTSKPIKSIHGIELYVIDEQRPPKVYKNGKIEPRYYHLTVHFKDIEAYTYFCKLTPIMESRALVKFGERKPLIYKKELEGISGHITIGSGCLIGMVMKNLLPDDEYPLHQRLEWAKDNYLWLRRVAGKGNFFVEVFPHKVDSNYVRPVYKGKTKEKDGFFAPILQKHHVCGPSCQGVQHFKDECGHDTIQIDIQNDANKFVIAMAKIYNDPVVISEDNHFSSPDDKVIQDVRLGNGLEKWKFSENYCMRDSDEWAANLRHNLDVSDRDIEEWIDNSYKFVDLFSGYKMETAKDRMLLPTIEMVYGHSGDTKQKLKELIAKHGRMPSLLHPEYQVYKDRLDMEISVLADNGVADFLPYVFVIEDAAEYARKNDILCNCRGSAGGSLVCYLLEISVTDPIKYGLQFERFLTLGRIKSGSLPDIDTDWQDKSLVIQYILKKYGLKAALISTNMMLKIKTSVRDVERFRTGSVSEETNILLKALPAVTVMSDSDWLFGTTDKTTGAHVQGFLEMDDPIAQEFKKYTETAHWVDDDGNKHLLWNEIVKCLAITKTKGVHAGGVIITPDNVSSYMPLLTPKEEGMLSTAYTMKYVEEVGGVKYDFLGVKTLASLGITMRALRDQKGVDLVWGEFPHDPEVYKKVIHAGKLAGLFQISTSTMRPFTLKIKPSDIPELANLQALVRPGTLEAPSPDPSDPPTVTAALYYVMCAQGVKQPYFIHPDLKPILGKTFGVLLNQEQALQIFRDIGGYSFEQAEGARRGIAKKDKDELLKHLNHLRPKCIERGWTEEQAQRLFDTIVASAKYSFNCIDAEQKIRTNKGMIPIKDICDNINDYEVLATDLLGSSRFVKPSRGLLMGKKEVIEVTLSNDKKIRCTEDHMFMSNGEWKTIKEIIENDMEIDECESCVGVEQK
jgi:DNA polymerase-3 subunit alpha